MVEAVAVSSGDSYQTVDGVLGGLGLEGSLKATGKVTTDAQGNIEKNIKVTIFREHCFAATEICKSNPCSKCILAR